MSSSVVTGVAGGVSEGGVLEVAGSGASTVALTVFSAAADRVPATRIFSNSSCLAMPFWIAASFVYTTLPTTHAATVTPWATTRNRRKRLKDSLFPVRNCAEAPIRATQVASTPNQAVFSSQPLKNCIYDCINRAAYRVGRMAVVCISPSLYPSKSVPPREEARQV